MSNAWRVLTEEYQSVLQDYLSGAGEIALQRAYELGRRALTEGLGALEVATLYHRALVAVMARTPTFREGTRTLQSAENCLVESLSAFEMTHRGFYETHMALRQSEERYRSLVENARDVIYTLSPDGIITSLNPCFETLTGWSCAEWIGKFFGPLIHPEDLVPAMRSLQQVLRGETVPNLELRILSKSAEYIPGEFMKTPLIKDGKVICILGIARDITERKRVEEALRRINQMMEEEAKRIARALHDEAGQLLASTRIALEQVAQTLPPSSYDGIQKVLGLLDQSEDQLRNLAHELRPAILDDLGLIPAFQFLADGVSKRSGLTITVQGEIRERPPSAVETALYQIVREALTNVTKHAKATHAGITLRQEDQILRCSIRDNGVGFSREAVSAKKGERGLGLIIIRERLNALGGALQVVSAPREGTELCVSIPLETE
jgi:PAS domain S-box-containing protein